MWVTHAGRCGACFTMEARCTGCVRVRGCEGVAECGMRWLGRRVVGQKGRRACGACGYVTRFTMEARCTGVRTWHEPIPTRVVRVLERGPSGGVGGLRVTESRKVVRDVWASGMRVRLRGCWRIGAARSRGRERVLGRCCRGVCWMGGGCLWACG